MPVDVVTSEVVARPREEVAAFTSDPLKAPVWYANIRSARWVTGPPHGKGSRVAFEARFLGKSLSYTYEIVEQEAPRLVMRTAEGPFPMETTYTWEDAGAGSTRMTLRNAGEPRGFAKVVAPMMAAAMRRENEKDLARLKALLESSPRPADTT